MTRAEKLREKIANKFYLNGIRFTNISEQNLAIAEKEDKVIFIKEVYRHNGTSENCSVEIQVMRLINGWRYEILYESGKITEKTGDRAIKNRIDKALEKFFI